MDTVFTSISIVVIIGGAVWFICTLLQRKAYLHPKSVVVPSWLAWLGGVKNNTVIPRLLLIQILTVLFVLWTVLVITIFPASEYRRLFWQRGCMFLFVSIVVLAIFLARLAKRP